MFDVGDIVTIDASEPLNRRSNVIAPRGLIGYRHGQQFEITSIVSHPTMINSKQYLVRSVDNPTIVFGLGLDHFQEFWTLIERGIFTNREHSVLLKKISRIIPRTNSASMVTLSFDTQTRTFENSSLKHINNIFLASETVIGALGLPLNSTLFEQNNTVTTPPVNFSQEDEEKDVITSTFKKLPYPIIYVNGFYVEKKVGITYRNYAFALNFDAYIKGKEQLTALIKIDNKFVVKRFSESSTKIPNIYKECNEILSLFKAKVVNIDESCRLFMHNKRKKTMLEASNNGKTFPITSYNDKYLSKKFNETHSIIELKDDQKSLKFVFKDIELVLPNFNGYKLPKCRDIKEKDECVIIKNKRLPVKIGSKVKVVQILGKGKFTNNKKIVVQTESKDTYVCRFRNLKKL